MIVIYLYDMCVNSVKTAYHSDAVCIACRKLRRKVRGSTFASMTCVVHVQITIFISPHVHFAVTELMMSAWAGGIAVRFLEVLHFGLILRAS